jgi:hypothetical protein
MPKAHLQADGGLDFEYTLAKDLHMTHGRLMQDLESGEIAYWRGKYELENERYDRARSDAARQAQPAGRTRR